MNEFDKLTRQAERIKKNYPEGTRIELIKMNDPYHPVEKGMRGTVEFVDDIGQIQVCWDNGRGLALVPSHDKFRKLTKEELSQECVDNIKRYYHQNDLKTAYKYWSDLYNLYETPIDATVKQRMSDSQQLQKYMSQIEDKIVYEVTDYGREEYYRQQGYYNDNIVTAENLNIGDIVLSDENDGHRWQVINKDNNGITFKDIDDNTFGGILEQTKISKVYPEWKDDTYKIISKSKDMVSENIKNNDEPDICD